MHKSADIADQLRSPLLSERFTRVKKMWFPTDNDLRIFMRNIVRVNEENERDNLRDDVVRMRDLLSLLLGRCMESPNPLPENVKQHFRDIYRSLELHMEFHGFGRDAAADILNLREVGEYLELGRDDAPEIECAIDPGSKLLEIVSKRKTKRILGMKSRNSLPGYAAFSLLTENT